MNTEKMTRGQIMKFARYFGIKVPKGAKWSKKYITQLIFLAPQRQYILLNIGKRLASGVDLKKLRLKQLKLLACRTGRSIPNYGNLKKSDIVKILLKKRRPCNRKP